jgi:hypothetical protein
VSAVVTAFRPQGRVRILDPVEAHERSIRRRLGWAWGLMVLDVLTFFPGIAIIPLPSKVAQAITQGVLPVAIVIVLTVNRTIMVRPSIFLCLVSLLPLEAILTALQSPHLGQIYRTGRLIEFVLALWLMTPWWGRRDLLLVRCHLTALSVVLGSVVLGMLIAPGRAFINGRLSGIIWPIPCTQVAHYAAVATGIVAVLWLSGVLRGRVALPGVVMGGGILLLTHTRTALIGMIAGILVAGLSLFAGKARVRKFFAFLGLLVSLVITTAAGIITAWLERGETGNNLTDLTGRTKVWSQVISFPRDKFQEIFGFGLANTSYQGLPIDSNWLASYMAQGLFGVTVCGLMLLFLVVSAYFRPRGAARALALFLVTYCLVASFTEDGFTDATSYLLDMALAASLLFVPYLSAKSAKPARPARPGISA